MNTNIAKQARDEAMEQIDNSTDDWWKDYVDDIIFDVAQDLKWFTADAVVDAMDPRLRMEVDMRALGPRMKAAQKQGIIEPTDRFELSRRSSRHSAPLRVWLSLQI